MKPILKRIQKKEVLVLILLLLLSLPAIYAFLQQGFPKTDDGDWMIIRFSSFYEELRNGQFPVRWLSRLNHGFGYPVANFLYPGFMYLGVPLKMLGLSFVETVKVLFIGSLFAAALFTYLWLRTYFSMISSIVGALVYVYLPYHLYDATVRGSLGELLALAVVPFVLWSLEKRYFFFSVIGIGFLILSHNTVAVLFLPVIIGYKLLHLKKTEWKQFVLTVFLGIATATFFWLPALTDLSATVFSHVSVSNPEEYFASLSQIGIMTFILMVGGVAILFIKKELRRQKIYVYWLGVFLLSFFMSTVLSKPLWSILPVEFIQFPFRFLSLTLLSGAIVAAYLMREVKPHFVVIVFLVGGLLLTNMYYLPSGYDVFDEGYYTTNQATTTVKNEYMPKGVINAPTQQPSFTLRESASFTHTVVKEKGEFTGTVRSLASEKGVVSQVYFPGWQVYVNGVKTETKAERDTGLVMFAIPQGESTVLARFEETSLRLTANIVSGVAVVLSLVLSLLFMKRRSNEHA